jgi:colanic acid biosynthesis glycosyl transferase WcaI
VNILFLTENFPPEENAAASRVYERACYWVEWGHTVTILTTAPNFPAGKLYAGYRNRWYDVSDLDGIRIVRVKSFIAENRGTVLRLLDFLTFMVTSFVAGMFQRRPDVIVATSPQIFTAVSGCFLSLVRRVPFVMELADLWPESVTAVGVMRESALIRLAERLELWLYRRAAAVVALTQAFKENLVHRSIPADKNFVVLNGVDLKRYSPRPKNRSLEAVWGLDGCFTIGYLGTHGMAHGLANVLEASTMLPAGSAIRFLMVGRGAEKESLMSEARKRNLDRVVFVPAQVKERIQEYWSLCDVALIHLRDSPTFRTVIPSKTFEAMAMGLPIIVVAPEGGEVQRIVEAGGVGVCVDAGDPAALARVVAELEADPDRLGLYRQASYELAPRYSRESQATAMIRVLESVQPQASGSRTGP